MLDTLCFKYVRPDAISSIVRDGTLLLKRAHELNDPFESSIEAAIAYTKPVKSVGWMDRKVTRARVGPFYEAVQINESDDVERKRQERKNDIGHNEALQGTQRLLQWSRENLGICSFTRIESDPVMWAHYAGNGTGACIAFDLTHPFFMSYTFETPPLSHHPDLFRPQAIAYRKNRPSYSGLSSIQYVRTAFLSKYERWEYEQEVRLLRPLSVCTVTAAGLTLMSFPREAIRRIVLGAATAKSTAAEVRSYIADLSRVGLYRATTVADTYELKLVGIRSSTFDG